jgi:hypothetical protein
VRRCAAVTANSQRDPQTLAARIPLRASRRGSVQRSRGRPLLVEIIERPDLNL